MKSTKFIAKYAVLYLLIQITNTTLIKELSEYQLDRSFKEKNIQFFIITNSKKSDTVKESLRKIETVFALLNETLENDLGIQGEEGGSSLSERFDVYEVQRSIELEQRFGLERQLSEEDRPIKINSDRISMVIFFYNFSFFC
jgi:hypothetical protein